MGKFFYSLGFGKVFLTMIQNSEAIKRLVNLAIQISKTSTSKINHNQGQIVGWEKYLQRILQTEGVNHSPNQLAMYGAARN